MLSDLKMFSSLFLGVAFNMWIDEAEVVLCTRINESVSFIRGSKQLRPGPELLETQSQIILQQLYAYGDAEEDSSAD